MQFEDAMNTILDTDEHFETAGGTVAANYSF